MKQNDRTRRAIPVDMDKRIEMLKDISMKICDLVGSDEDVVEGWEVLWPHDWFEGDGKEESTALEQTIKSFHLAAAPLWALKVSKSVIATRSFAPLANLDYEAKKAVAAYVNHEFRTMNFAIQHPHTQEPCVLFAVASRDGKGRFVLESMVSKKRSHSTNDLTKLMPFKGTVAPMRMENFAKYKRPPQ